MHLYKVKMQTKRPQKRHSLNNIREVMMQASLPLNKMTINWKTRCNESKFGMTLCVIPDDIPSPEWHNEVLSARAERVHNGKAHFKSFDTVKSELRSEFKWILEFLMKPKLTCVREPNFMRESLTPEFWLTDQTPCLKPTFDPKNPALRGKNTQNWNDYLIKTNTYRGQTPLLKECSYTEDALAEKLGVTRQTVNTWISDIRARQKTNRNSTIIRLSRLGWTQDKIAQIAGLSRNRASEIVGNANICNIDNLLDQGHNMEYIAAHFQKTGFDLYGSPLLHQKEKSVSGKSLQGKTFHILILQKSIQRFFQGFFHPGP